RHDAVHQAVDLDVGALRVAVVEQQHGAAALAHALLQLEDLAAVAQRALREQAHFGKRVEGEARRPAALDRLVEELHELRQLDLGRLKERRRPLGADGVLDRRELDDLDSFQAPAVRRSYRFELGPGFGQRHVEATLADGPSVQQELHGYGGLAYAREAFHEIEAVARQAAAENAVEAGHPGSAPVADRSHDAVYRWRAALAADRKSTRLNSSHVKISYAVFCLKKKRI